MITKFNIKDKSIVSYAIRKLTPRECFRLMGVRDNTIDKMQSTVKEVTEKLGDISKRTRARKDDDMVISDSQQYKQAGNSIVVDVLEQIYEKLWYSENSPKSDNTKKNILTTFSGYDSQMLAADLLKQKHSDFDWTCVGWSDIDKYACLMHDIIFPEYKDKALGDITKIDWKAVKESLNGEDIDLFTYSSPCQDISQAGKQNGLKEGDNTRSALLWYVTDAVKELRPKFLLQENVKALVSKKFMPDFQKWLNRLDEMGYRNYYAVLNSKNYGVPQSRERVFCVSIRKDIDFEFEFPQPFELVTTTVKDMLETKVQDKYFLSDDSVYKYMVTSDTDNNVFTKFDVPHTHENAMFIKTWLTPKMKNKWELSTTVMKEYIESLHDEFEMDFNTFVEHGICAFDSDFQTAYIENMK